MSIRQISQSYTQQSNLCVHVFIATLLISIVSFVALQEPLMLGIPVSLVFVYLAIKNVFSIFIAFFISLPFTIELFLLNGLATDIPAEPLMILLTVISMLILTKRIKRISSKVVKHPITIFLLLHLVWILFTAIYSEQSIVSIKFFVAKLWYVVPFYFLAPYIINDQKKILLVIRLVLIALVFSMVVVLTRHATVGFSFQDIHYAVKIFYRNHVNYACLIAVFIPFFFLWCKYEYKNGLVHWIKIPIAVLFIVALYLSYTRAAMVAVFLVIPISLIVRYRLMKWVITGAFVVILSLIAFLSFENKYLDFAPDYQKTITHLKFDNLLEATVKMEDISTMERVYRWVAGAHMLAEKPYMGFGPGNFYFYYKKYTISSFKTYVSDNPEKSGMHNYYMMTVVEQGIIGIILFLLIPICALIYSERLYHLLPTGFSKDLLLCSISVLGIILAINFMNDMLETAKQGPFFFWSLGIIAAIGIKYRDAIS